MDETQANGSLPNGSASKKAAPSKEDIENAEKAKVEGNAAFKSSNWQEAVDRYSEAITLDPTNATFLTNRAAALMSQKKFKPALDDCQKASSLQHDSSAKTLIRLARCYFNLGNAEQAQTILNKIIQNAAPAKATGKKGGARAVNGSSSSVPTTTFTSEEVASAKGLEAQVKRLKDHLQQSERYRMNKQWTLANIALDKAIQEIGASGDSSLVPFSWRASKAYHYLGKGDLDAANSAATELLRLDSNNSEALVLRARVLFAKGELAKAIAHAQAALRSDPDLQAARSLMRKCKKLEGIKAEGNAAFKAGTFDQAIAKYDEALSVVTDEEGQDGHAPSFKATLYSNRATANSRLGNHEQTVKDCDTALELDKNYIKALRTRARAYLKLERYEEAVQDFKKALEESSISEESSSDTMNLKKELRSAEIDLKRSKQKDYYKILGVEKDASDIDIKKAYKRESLKHHPDKGGDEEKFKLVTEAFSVLSDPTKRRRFDMGADDADSDMPDAFGGGMGGFGGMGGMGGMGGAEINLADILAGMGGGGGHGFGGAPGGFGGMHGSSFAGAGGPYGGAGRRGGPSGFSFQ